ncbi:hypothetical protein JY651_38490 [Pyxidicoccus parkwayensis]|uniref:Outer membrane protein beta-barrel domain-containing protein n=1 Tax=Pyxidicoccus parkwayensis TaxID=2813578 RepID=A0ABX7NQB3_9BACT|nr:hypothetical protein [Pyxidicoccus parkwaysis]QSQ21044.1 hypothetical protein JY651_38490 [Pyxidicoccus parkwaysis]
MPPSSSLSSLLLAAGVSLAPALALAEETTERRTTPLEQNLNSMDRFFPLSESASTPPSDVRAETSGSANDGGTGIGGSYGISQRVEMNVLKNLSLRAGGELRMGTGKGFSPEAQVKYQFFNQAVDGLNASAGLRYKQIGFASDGGEAEVFLSAGKRWGQLLGTANFVAGTGVSKREADIEGHVGLGYLLGEKFIIGANTRFQQEVVDEPGEVKGTGREFEMLTGGLAGYSWGPVDLSALAGWYFPRKTMTSGPLAMLQLGLNF